MERRFVSLATVWLLGSFAVLALLATITWAASPQHCWLAYRRIAKNGATAKGTIVRTQPSQHAHVDYRFSAEGKQFSGSGNSCCVRVGDSVLVTYLVDNPAVSCLGDANARFINELIPGVLASVTIPVLLILRFRVRTHSPPN